MAFSITLLVFLLFTPGDAGLSPGNVAMIFLFSALAWIPAFFGFLLGILTIGLGVFVILAKLRLTGRGWAAGGGALMSGLIGWSCFVGGYVTTTGVAVAIATAIGGLVGGLVFRQVAYRPIKPPPPPPARPS